MPAQARSPLPGTGVLTEDEARYVNGLFDAGAPAPAIANVIQQLISRRQDSGPSSPSPPLVDRRKDLD